MEDPNDAAIVASIIAITHHLNLKVVAEGVETEEQLQFLHKKPVQRSSGYLFSLPLPPEKCCQCCADKAA